MNTQRYVELATMENFALTEHPLVWPEAVLPEQFYQLTKGSPATTGPRALMAAILEDALLCFQKAVGASGKRSERLAREAEEWLFSEEEQWLFSYLNICATLGIDAEYLRRGLLQWCRRREQRLQVSRTRTASAFTTLQVAA